MGSLWFAIALSGVLTTQASQSSISAGQKAFSPVVCRQSQTIALTLRPIYVLPMTHHVECVALLEPARQ